VDVLLVGRVQAEAVGQADRLLVEALQLGIRQVLDRSRPVQQLAVQQLPAQRLGQEVRDLVAAGPVLARYGNHVDVHATRSGEGH
jgi:hypothetical protein